MQCVTLTLCCAVGQVNYRSSLKLMLLCVAETLWLAIVSEMDSWNWKAEYSSGVVASASVLNILAARDTFYWPLAWSGWSFHALHIFNTFSMSLISTAKESNVHMPLQRNVRFVIELYSMNLHRHYKAV